MIIKAERKSVFTAQSSHSQKYSSIQLLAIASKIHPFCREKKVFIRSYVLKEKDRNRLKCALYCFLVTFKYNDEVKVYIYKNKYKITLKSCDYDDS